MFGTSGIRGPIGDTVTPGLAVEVGSAVARWGADRVVLGRDPRPSGEYLCQAAASGLRQHGTDVLEVGTCATPTIARAVGWYDADCGIAVTASHNPPTDNGFKLWLPSGQAFRPAEQDEIVSMMEDGRAREEVRWDEVGDHRRRDGATGRHLGALLEVTELAEPLDVVVDVGNGAGGVTATALDRLGCDVVTINAQPAGGFPGRPSEPTAANCDDLRATVPAVGADLGIAHDGDADRMRAVDARGEFVSGDTTLALFARAEAGPGDRVAAPIDASLAIEDTLAAADVELIRTPVGDVFVAEAIREADAAFGGEPSGAWIWPAATLCPDGPLAACKLVELVARGRPLHELVGEIAQYPLRRQSIEVGGKDRIMAEVLAALEEDDRPVETMDGIRVDAEAGWFLIRPSGTESKIRLTSEAPEAARAEALMAEARSLVEGAVERSQNI